MREHWDAVHGSRAPDAVSWYAPHLEDSLTAIRLVSTPEHRVIDVGAGASTLVDDLLACGYRNVALLDVSSAALDITRARLGVRSALVRWMVGDVTEATLPEAAFEVWHDRAVFHFLGDATSRAAYAERARHAVRAGGHVVIGAFAPHGPERCSGLAVQRYDAAALGRELGSGFALRGSAERLHHTPAGATQAFTFCTFERLADVVTDGARP